jgi:hypothetical protein
MPSALCRRGAPRRLPPMDVAADPAWSSLLPPLLAIGMALVTRQIIPSLVLGVWVGAWLVEG